MTEALKSIRLIHRLLIVVAATMVVSSLAPRNWQRYADAAEEVEALLQLPLDSLEAQIGNVLREEISDDRPFDVYVDSLIPRRGTTRFRHYLIADADSIPDDALVHTGETFSLARSPTHPSVGELYDYLAELRVIGLIPSSVEFRERASLRLPDGCAPCVLTSLHIVPSGNLGSPPIWDTRLRFRDSHGVTDSLTFPVFQADTVPLRVVFPPGRSWVWARMALADSAGADWATKRYLRPILTDGVASEEGLLPRLQLVWSEIRELGLSEALSVLRQRASEERNSFSLAGLSMSDNVAVTIATPILLAFLWYLYVMLGHVARLLSDSERGAAHRREALEFPLVLFFKGTAAELFSVGSVALLPAGSVALVFLRAEAGNFPPWWRVMLYGLGVAAVFAAGAACLSTAEAIASGLHQPVAPLPDAPSEAETAVVPVRVEGGEGGTDGG